MSNPNAAAADQRAPRLLIAMGVLALAGYGAFLARNFSPVAGGADSSGYLNSARLLASGHFAAELRVPSEFSVHDDLFRQQFQPHGFAPFEGREGVSPTYAVGLPLHLALVAKVLGWTAGPTAVGVGSALATIVLCFVVARQLGLGVSFSVAAAVMLGAFPVLFYMSLQPLSDGLAVAWCLAAVSAALRARERPGWAFACGAACAMAVLVRATNALLLPALVVFLGWNARRWLFAALGGAPGAVFLGYYNHVLYGGAFRSGYVNISEAFAWAYGPPTCVHFVKWLVLMLPAVVVPLAVWGWVAPHVAARTRLGLGLWFGAFFAFYAFYEISREVWWDLRFILPGTPALIIAALLMLEHLVRFEKPRLLVAGGLVIWAVVLGAYWPRKFHLLLTKEYERAYADAAAAARAQFPPGSLVLAGHHSGSLYFYTSFPVLRWELVNAKEFARFRELAQSAGRSICALLYDIEEKEALQEHCPARWTRVLTMKNVSLWRLEAAAPASK